MNRRLFFGFLASVPFLGGAAVTKTRPTLAELKRISDEWRAGLASSFEKYIESSSSAGRRRFSLTKTYLDPIACREWMFADRPLCDEFHEDKVGKNASI
jgi:hypothetical protein